MKKEMQHYSRTLSFAWQSSLLLILVLPLIGFSFSSQSVNELLEFPPVTVHIHQAEFSPAVFLAYAVFVLITIAPFVVHWLKHRPTKTGRAISLSKFPWWGYSGMLLCAVSTTIAWTRFPFFSAIQPHTFFFLWLSYIITMNALCFQRTGRSPFQIYGARYLLLFPVSAFLWWGFEYLNRFTQNWTYPNVKQFSALEYFVFASLSFSTILPAMFATKEWLSSFSREESSLKNFHTVESAQFMRVIQVLAILAATALALVSSFPNALFPALWLSPLILLCAVQVSLQQRTIFDPIYHGDWREVVQWALAALWCGVFWELWNYQSFAKWIYHVPYVDALRVFEMPLIGYAGYLPFGVLCCAVVALVIDSNPADKLRHDMENGHSGMLRPMLDAPPLDPERSVSAPRPRYALLLNPFYAKDPHGSFGKHVLTPSLALTSIAAATPGNWTVRYWDENLLQGPPPTEPFPSVVGITVHLTFAKRAYQLARWYRARGAKVILGGLHVMSCPAEAAQQADALALGEGVQLWPEILRDVENGMLQSRYIGSYKKPYRQDPSPRRTILSRRDFLTTTSVIASRGCHNRCTFCYLATNGLHVPYQTRDVEQVAAEFVAEGRPYGVFIDNNLGSNPVYLLELCHALCPLEKIWSAAVSLDITDHPATVREMALSGCTGVFIGFETLNPENLADARKKSPLPDDYTRRIDIFHRYGIQVNGSFVLGFDHDDPDIFQKLISWIEEVRMACATFHILTPYPGTPLFQQLEAEGRILHHNWDLYDTSHVVFRPKKMSATELEEGYAWCYRTLFSHQSIWRRRPETLAEQVPYLTMTYLYKRANRFWPFLIRHRLTGLVWGPFIELARRRNMTQRQRLAAGEQTYQTAAMPVSPGV